MKKQESILLIVVAIAAMVQSCSKPQDVIKGKTWVGSVYRQKDNKELSPVVLRMSNDSLFVYANAIFGADNDTLLLARYNEKDSIFTFVNHKHDSLQLAFTYKNKKGKETLLFEGNTFNIVLVPSNVSIHDKSTLAFYRNMVVPLNANLYLDGAYEGQMEMENQFQNYYLMGIGGLTFKIVFVDGSKLKFYTKNVMINLFSSGSKKQYDLYEYHYEGNNLVWYNEKKKVVAKIKNEGSTIVLEDDNCNVVMHKLY